MNTRRHSRYLTPVSMRALTEVKREAEPVPKDLTDQAVRDLRVVFASFQDSDRGVITIAQLAEIVELLGQPKPDISVLREMLAKLSDRGEPSTRLLDFKRFLRFFVCHLHGGTLSVRSREIFSAFDCDTNASVSAFELQESLASMGMMLNEEEALAMTSVADGSVDGEVNYHEFKQICKRLESDLGHCPSGHPLGKGNGNAKKGPGSSWMRSPLTTPGSVATPEKNSFQNNDQEGDEKLELSLALE